MHRLGNPPVKSECRIEADIGRPVDARRQTVGMNIASRRVKAAAELNEFPGLDHSGNLPALIARFPQPVLHPQRVNDWVRQMIIYVHYKQDSCNLCNYQEEMYDI
jgi:hypothetical protein